MSTAGRVEPDRAWPVVAGAVGAMALSTTVMATAHLPCPMLATTGLFCPLCGGTRAVLAVVHGDLVRAAQDNLVVLLSPVLVLGYLLLRVRRSQAERRGRISAVAAVLLLLALWTVIRNLPLFAFAQPTGQT